MAVTSRTSSPPRSRFFFTVAAPSYIHTLSLHDALPICRRPTAATAGGTARAAEGGVPAGPSGAASRRGRSEEHTSELQSRQYLVCRLLLEKKKIERQYSPAVVERLRWCVEIEHTLDRVG